ncbi:hypothetical protein DL767_004844 [Monosporascus sp. MG133]|nr:hypothetical protein DL767_004844 [Monosporascus sp. MG133]
MERSKRRRRGPMLSRFANANQPLDELTTAELEYPSGPKLWLVVFALCLVIFVATLLRHASLPGRVRRMRLRSFVFRFDYRHCSCRARLFRSPSRNFLLGPFTRRPIETAHIHRLIGTSLGLGTALGPLIGGLLTENVTWRWIFYINLPIGAFSYAVFVLFIRPPKGKSKAFTSLLDLLETLDLVGLTALSGSGKAMLLSRIFTQPAVIATVWFCFFASGSSFLLAYYVPLWFQGVEGASPLQSGINTLPLVIANTIASFSCGMMVPIVGYVWPFMLAASVTTTVGSGLFTTFQVSTPTGRWIGYQIIYGLGMGFSSQTPLMSVQNVLPDVDVPLGPGIAMFIQIVAGAISTAVTQALFANTLVQGLDASGADVSAADALSGGLTTITEGLNEEERRTVLQVINDALTDSWLLPVVLTSIIILGVIPLAVKNQKIKGKEARCPRKNLALQMKRNDEPPRTLAHEQGGWIYQV